MTPPHRRWPRRLARGDDGSALIEFIGLSILLLVPLIYLLVTVFAIQRAAFGVTQAAREAGRAFATAPTAAVGMQPRKSPPTSRSKTRGCTTEPRSATAPAAGEALPHWQQAPASRSACGRPPRCR